MIKEDYKILINNPSGECPLIDYRRDFDVSGKLYGKIDDDCLLKVEVFNEEGDLVRHVSSDKKNNRNCFVQYEKLVSYKEELDPKKEKLLSFGFPELQVKDLNDPYTSLHDASIKCFYNGTDFKAVIVSASDIKHGRIMETGMNYTDETGQPYDVLSEGEYRISVSLYKDDKLLTKEEKKIRIGIRKKASIVRFNPTSHHDRMTKWCEEKGLDIVNDTIPGYLEPYLGTWYYHMGLLPYYRSNDIAVYQDSKVSMFVYLTDPTSTSYETELAYLQKEGKVADENFFEAYHYDIGEAFIGKDKPYERRGEILKFEEDDLSLCRIDLVDDAAEENIFDLSEAHIEDVFYDRQITLKAGSRFAVMGVCKPRQLNKEDVILKEDNTYEICHEISEVHYCICNGTYCVEEERNLMMERIDHASIGTSVYEFYNIFEILEEDKGKTLNFRFDVRDDRGIRSSTSQKFSIKVI